MTPSNIYIIGAQSTGKTTLVNALKDYFTKHRKQNAPEPLVISELARNVLNELDINRHDIATSPDKSLKVQSAILKAQYKAETEAEKAGAWYVADRSGLDPIVYARLSVSEEAAQILVNSPEWKVLEHNMKSGVVFVCEAGCAWLIDDGVRWLPDSPSHWDEFDQAFRKLLIERGIGYQVVPRDVSRIDERVKIVVGEG